MCCYRFIDVVKHEGTLSELEKWLGMMARTN